MMLRDAIDNLRRTLDERQPSPRGDVAASRARTGNTKKLVLNAQAVIDAYDRFCERDVWGNVINDSEFR
jgi:hypothetical protein